MGLENTSENPPPSREKDPGEGRPKEKDPRSILIYGSVRVSADGSWCGNVTVELVSSMYCTTIV
jgi:hypothetical protein